MGGFGVAFRIRLWGLVSVLLAVFCYGNQDCLLCSCLSLRDSFRPAIRCQKTGDNALAPPPLKRIASKRL